MDPNDNLDPSLRTGSSDTETPPTPVASRSNGRNRRKRNKEETEANRKEEAQRKKIRELEKGQASSAPSGKKQRGRGASQSNRSSSQSCLVNNSNMAFTHEDYELVCSYLEDDENFAQLYGSGEQTAVGPRPLTKSAAYDMFAIYMNSHCNKRYSLTGAQLCQRVNRYKKKFAQAKQFAENTGAGIEAEDGPGTLAEILETKCPCYERMEAIFGSKPNVTPCMQYDLVDGRDLYGNSGSGSGKSEDQGREEVTGHEGTGDDSQTVQVDEVLPDLGKN
jgi:hypothetical protein